ncbi:MAG: hypothetical protein EOP86_08600 [Verrucomicrobiaceae bacterium]|nr:MAG: hypothetical protein EOP86_08600 [Verrucomicrobiaceae bacterium]
MRFSPFSVINPCIRRHRFPSSSAVFRPSAQASSLLPDSFPAMSTFNCLPNIFHSFTGLGCAAVVFLLPGFAPCLKAEESGDFTYSIHGRTIEITGYTGTAASVTIPGRIRTVPVTSIGDRAFYLKSALTEIIIPDSVISIGVGAFSRCGGLTGIVIPDSVISIGNSAFLECTGLTSITIPDSVTGIGSLAFSRCSSLISVAFSGNGGYIAGDAFRMSNGLERVFFKGNAPTIGGGIFEVPAATFFVSPGSTGFTFPTWQNRPSILLNSSGGTFAVLRDNISFPNNGTLEMDAGLIGTTVTRVFSVLNTSDIPQSPTVSLSAGSSTAFSLKTDSIPGTLPPWKSASFAVSFNPSEAGPVTAGIDISASEPLAEPCHQTLTGTGVKPTMHAWRASLTASNSGVNDLFGDRAAASGDTLVIGAPYEDSSGSGEDDSLPDSGAVYVFVKSETGWSEQARLKAANAGAGDHFGRAVSIDGDTLIVGASEEDSNATGVNGDQSNDSAPDSGAAYIFTRTGGVWTQQARLKASNTGANDFFGNSVSISGDIAAVGARLEDSAATGVNGDQSSDRSRDSGAVYLFERIGGVWSQSAYLKASNTGALDWFGHYVGVSGGTVVVSARDEASRATGVNGNQSDNARSGSGAAYVFVKTGSVWTQQAYLKASNTDLFDNFGHSAAISGDTIIIGAPYEDSKVTGVNGNQLDNNGPDSGAAYVFVRSGSTWTQQAYLKATNGTSPVGVSEGLFGWNVSISGDTAVVGAPESNGGAAYVFQRNGTTWIQHANLKVPNPGGGRFGRSTAVSGGTIVIGAHSGSGAAYVFQAAAGPNPAAIQQWRLAHFGTTDNTGAAADTSDPDGDGSSNLDEFTAGTLPKDREDAFKVSHAFKTRQSHTLMVPGKAGRFYQLVRSRDPAADIMLWIPVATAGPFVTDRILTLTDPSAPDGRAFYRVIVSMP